jgi:hypothetical protein
MSKPLKESDLAKLILLAALLFGGWLRFYPVVQAGFPINDGGMFYSMIEDLYANNFILPRYTSYNLSDIPYAYPPLGFYLGALLKLFGIDTLHILMYLPPALSVLVILAFFGLAKKVFDGSWSYAALATLAFALIPGSYSWFIMGGGLTRSLGQLFFLLFLTNLLKLYEAPTHRQTLYTGLFGSLAILSHPEISIHAFTAAVIFWFFRSRNQKGLRASLAVAGIAVTLAAPWWASVLWQHGTHPFLNALQTGGHTSILVAFKNILYFAFTEETLAPIVAVLGMIGIIYQIGNKNYFLTIWIIITFITQPRSATAIALYPLSMLFAITLVDIILPAMTKGLQDNTTPRLMERKKTWIIIAFLTIYMAASGSIHSIILSNYYINNAERQLLQWVQENTIESAQFIVIADVNSPMVHHTAEWFPALTQRRSLLTVQGSEWTQGKRLFETMIAANQANDCLRKNIECIEQLTSKHDIKFDFVYISQMQVNDPGPAQTNSEVNFPIILELRTSSQYQIAFENESVVIFYKNP